MPIGIYDPLFGLGEGDILPKTVPATGGKRLLGLAVRGASLSAFGAKTKPEGLLEHGAEFLGSIPTIAASAALLSPVAGAGVRALGVGERFLPIASRLSSAGLTGAGVGGTQAGFEGESIPKGAAMGAAEFATAESGFLAGAKVISRMRGVPHKVEPEMGVKSQLLPDEAIAAKTVDTARESKESDKSKPFLTRKLEKIEEEYKTGKKEAEHANEFVTAQGREALTTPETATGETDPRAKTFAGIKELKQAREAGDYKVILSESGLKEVIDKTPEAASQEILFNAKIDPKTGLPTYTPANPRVEDAIRMAEQIGGKAPHQMELPNLSQDVKQQLATEPKREMYLTDNAIKSDERLETLMEDKHSPLKIAEPKIIEFSPEELMRRDLMDKMTREHGVKPEIVQHFMKSIPSGLTPAARQALIENFLKGQCV